MGADRKVRGRTAARHFFLRAAAWNLGFFGLLRLNWTEAHVVLPIARLQAGIAGGLLGAPVSPIEVTIACSGADALALCLGAILAYPVTWKARLRGSVAGVGLLVGLNLLRIGTLGRAAAAPAWFNALHVYIWPAIFTVAIAAYVFGWMRQADRRSGFSEPADSPVEVSRQARLFFGLAATLVLLFSAASPLYLENASVLRLAGFIARAAAALLDGAGVDAYAAGNVLWTPRGGFLVTQECIATPLVAVYLAGTCVGATTWPRLTLGVLATLPLFIALGIVRLLVVALPDAVMTSPLFIVHAFYQLLLGAVIVFFAARWRYGARGALRHALLGIVVGAVFVNLLGPWYSRAVIAAAGPILDDPQDAIAFLPAFQVGLYVALWVAAFVAAGWKRFLAGLAVLVPTQVAVLVALHALESQAGLTAHVRDVRGWAIAGPLLIVSLVINVRGSAGGWFARPHR